ncbi:16S rRNA (guanine(527)-N(7))-methyltransferase RsmG [Mycoplasma sp. E35C]|uniref:16S rRNA (guanine(527)-N(7))-methyltransferase RsmG n=1 Tax=Mycoplasma sp. E35C TaxID=2801918 RepID=UPI001CA39B4F|nr:16S rRNA (guanine(527)-N(7))-methyltransferase RsmG [Mycoplasma sp. E35C]QZX49083.1 16S rRNA (guanine(527)-N(7))-methyltransferase RsmG [Mycoplasma sp. E35C]
MLNELNKQLELLKIDLSDDQKNKISIFLEQIAVNNQLFNLTGYKTKELIVSMLGIKSILLANSLKDEFLNQNLKVIDIGTGAGIPGIIIKILYPNLDITLLDSNNKKINFINEVIKLLDLKTTEAISFRVEDKAFLNQYQNKFDFAFSQAVSNIAVLNELSVKLLKIHGKIIHFKSKNFQTEIDFAQPYLNDLGLTYNKLVEFVFNDYFLVNVFYNKNTETSDKYPREWSKIKKELIKDAKH